MNKLSWSEVKRTLEQLDPWAYNPREIYEDEAERLRESRKIFGEIEPFLIGPNNEMYDGHQRRKVWGNEYGMGFEVTCWQSNRALTEEERKKLVVYKHKGATGSFDYEMLKNTFDWDDLTNWGFEDWEFKINDDEPPTLDELEDEYSDADDEFLAKLYFELQPDVMERWVNGKEREGIIDDVEYLIFLMDKA